MKLQTLVPAVLAGTVLLSAGPIGSAIASSHMDAPLITLDDAANTTDVYAFRSRGEDGTEYLSTALSVYPFEEPGIGPNNYRFDDNVLYEIHVALADDVADGRSTITYQFQFDTRYRNQDTILQGFLGPIQQIHDENQNLRQTYKVTKVDFRPNGSKRFSRGKKSLLGKALMVPPNNQGRVTPLYNQGNDGDNPAKEGVEFERDLDVYTRQSIHDIAKGYRVFAGQRDDGFYADIQSIFDLDFAFSGPNKPFDSQGGFNVHTIVLNIPLDELKGAKVAGVYATTSRRQVEVLRDGRDPINVGRFVQVGRQGNPLFAEALVAIRDKDRYNTTRPTSDNQLFRQYADDVELARPEILNATPVVDIAGIFIPDMITVDLTTGPARLAGQPGFDRLSGVFAILDPQADLDEADVLFSEDGTPVFGGWPNGRRFGDDVVDIAIAAIGVDITNEDGVPDLDGVTENDITYNIAFPYAATPLNGRNHPHHSETDLTN